MAIPVFIFITNRPATLYSALIRKGGLFCQESDTLVVPSGVMIDLLSGASNRLYLYFRPTTTLPVRFVRFDAFVRQASVELNWSVDQEQGIETYHVERSVDGRNFEGIGQVAVTNQSASLKKYQFVDQQVAGGQLFYRVQAIERRRSSCTSPVVRLDNVIMQQAITITRINANGSANGYLQFSHLPIGRYHILISNANGQRLFAQWIDAQLTNTQKRIQGVHSKYPLVIQVIDVTGMVVKNAIIY